MKISYMALGGALLITTTAPLSTALAAAKPAKSVAKSPTSADREARDKIIKPFFSAVLKGEYTKGMEGLSSAFAISEGKRSYLAERMEALDKKLGRAASYQRLGERRLTGSKRLVVEYYATYHALKPAVWELTFYKAPASDTGPERWMLTSMRFETEKVMELVEGIRP